MSIYLGDKKISGNSKELCFPLFTPVWQDHIVNNASWLRSETFSWQSGAVYVSAYNHLADDLTGITSETETVAGTTITFYRATDGHKIVLADQETNVSTIYTATGVAWYYVLDTNNTRFKLPRSEWDFVGLRDNVGNYVEESLPNHDHITHAKGTFSGNYFSNDNQAFSGGGGSYFGTSSSPDSEIRTGNASESNSAYQDNAPVQQRATQMYLYFYVGNTVQDQTTIDVGELAEDLNGKADIDLGNLSNAGKIVSARMSMPSDVYTDLSPVSGVSYTAPSDGWVNVRGTTTVANGYVYMYVNDTGADYNICYAPGINYEVGLTMPVRKAQTFNVSSGGATLTRVRFFYAEGSKSEA